MNEPNEYEGFAPALLVLAIRNKFHQVITYSAEAEQCKANTAVVTDKLEYANVAAQHGLKATHQLLALMVAPANNPKAPPQRAGGADALWVVFGAGVLLGLAVRWWGR